jgi:hypothetical protein
MASFPIGSHYDQVHLSNEEMLKGVIDRAIGGPYLNTQTVIVPVIENAPSEGCPEVSFWIFSIQNFNKSSYKLTIRQLTFGITTSRRA